MHCKSCDYPLWNIAPPASGGDRPCPECGTPFKPSDYRFTPNSVRFCCPQCKLAYFGTSPEGLLEPPAFTCLKCSEPCTIDRMILLPGEGVPEHITRGGIFPWQDSSQFRTLGGKVRVWFNTCSSVAFTPTRAGKLLAEMPRLREALTYYLVTSIIFAFLGIGWLFVLIFGFGLFNLGIHVDAMSIATAIGQFLAGLLAGPLLMLVYLLINALLTMLLARRLGAPQVTYPLVLECHLYCIAGAWLVAIPCIAVYIGPLTYPWMIISAALMLAARSNLSILKSLIAVASPSLFLLAVLVGFFILVRL